MSNNAIEIRGCYTIQELMSVVDLCDRAFPKTDREYFDRHILKDRTLEPEDTRVLIKDGNIVSSVQVFPRKISHSSGTIKFGGIGNVATLPEERKNGYAGMLLNDALKYMKEKELPLAMLSTHINSYYEKFGFNTVKRTVARIINVKSEESGEIRHFDFTGDLRGIMSLYNVFNKCITGAVIRDEKYWLSQFDFSGEDKDLFFVYESNSELSGFIRAKRRQDFVQVLEYAFMNDDKSILAKLIKNLAAVTGLSEFELFLTKKEEANLDKEFPFTLRDENDFMICILDKNINKNTCRELYEDRNLNFWQSDFF